MTIDVKRFLVSEQTDIAIDYSLRGVFAVKLRVVPPNSWMETRKATPSSQNSAMLYVHVISLFKLIRGFILAHLMNGLNEMFNKFQQHIAMIGPWICKEEGFLQSSLSMVFLKLFSIFQ